MGFVLETDTPAQTEHRNGVVIRIYRGVDKQLHIGRDAQNLKQLEPVILCSFYNFF
jgi:hypothetical protein